MVIHCICFFKWLKLNQRNRSGLESGGGGFVKDLKHWEGRGRCRLWKWTGKWGRANIGNGLECGKTSGEDMEVKAQAFKTAKQKSHFVSKHSHLPLDLFFFNFASMPYIQLFLHPPFSYTPAKWIYFCICIVIINQEKNHFHWKNIISIKLLISM